MKNSSYRIAASSIFATALLVLMLRATGSAQQYSIRPTCNPKGQCKVSTATFGFNDTNWRQWPCQPRPEEQDPKTIGAHAIPTPPSVLEAPLPHAESLPAKPPLSGGSILPTPGTTPGATPAPDSSKTDAGKAATPNGRKREGAPGEELQVPVPQGLQGLPEGLDLGPGQPDNKAKKDGGGIQPLTPSKDSLLPGGITPDVLTPTPGTPAAEPAKTPDKDAPASKSLLLPPDLMPSPAAKPDESAPAKPTKGSSLSRRQKNALAAEATPDRNELPMRANWDASLEPDVVNSHQLQSVSFQQRTEETAKPFRRAMEGYCPVELKENDRWVAGNPAYRTVYGGKVFFFSSEAARQRFETSPKKYAPTLNGNDVVMATKGDRTVPGNVNYSAVWHGRLYLFSNSATLAAFQHDPTRYANVE